METTRRSEWILEIQWHVLVQHLARGTLQTFATRGTGVAHAVLPAARLGNEEQVRNQHA